MKILLTEDQFAIDLDGEQGEFVPYGELATLTASNNERYIAMCDDPDGEPLVYRIADNLKLVRQPATTEDVELAGDEDEEEAEEIDE